MISDKINTLVKYPPKDKQNCVKPSKTAVLISAKIIFVNSNKTSNKIKPPHDPLMSAPLSVICKVKNAPISKNSHHLP